MTAIADRRVRRRRRMACLLGLGVGAATLACAAAGSATTPVGGQFAVSTYGSDGVQGPAFFGTASAFNPRTGQHLIVWSVYTSHPELGVFGRLVDSGGAPVGTPFRISEANGVQPAVAYSTRANEFMVVWRNTTPSPTGDEIYGRRVGAAGAALGTQFRISQTGPETDSTFNADSPAVTYNEQRDEYLVAWSGSDGVVLAAGEDEVHVQRLSPTGAEIGTDRRISDMGPDGDASYTARQPSVAWNERRDEYLVAWAGTDGPASEREIHVQRLAGDAAELGVNDRRVTEVGPAGNVGYEAEAPAVVHNPVVDEYLVAFRAEDDAAPRVEGEYEVHVQRLGYEGTEVGADDQRVSDMGPDGNDDYLVLTPRVAVNIRANEYLVTWQGEDDVAPLVDGTTEVFSQRLSAAGVEIDGNDIRVSVTLPEGDAAADSGEPTATYNPGTNQYLIAWAEDDNLPPVVPFEAEMVARRFGAGTVAAVAGARCKVLPPLADPPQGDPSKVALTVEQLLINQRIDQAAIRRANGVQAWIDAGVETRDLCQGIIDAKELTAGAVTGYTGVPLTLGPADPRPVIVPPPTPGDPAKVTLTVNQLLINQRISQAAIRRLNALKARLDQGLTGGDVDDAAVGRAQLVAGTRVLFAPVLSPPPPASLTSIAPATSGDPSKVTLSVNQLLINQRISQVAVKRANELIHRLGQGIGPEEIRDGTLTAADLAPGLPASTTP